MQFNALSVIKFAVSTVVGVGAGKIVKSVIVNNMSAPETLLDKVSMVSGAWVLAGIVTKASKKYTDDAIDDIAEATTEIVNKFKMASKLGRINRDESTFEEEGLDPEAFIKSPATKKWTDKHSFQERMLERVNAGELTPEFFLDPKVFEKNDEGKWVFIVEKTNTK